MSLLACRVDGVAGAALPADDRGLAYGDGVFETVLLDQGRAVWWHAHLRRLAAGAQRLGLALPGQPVWDAERDCALAALAQHGQSRGVLKLILSRGSSGRGYPVDPAQPARRIALLGQAPARAAADQAGLRLHPCALRLAAQPALAGIKHLNRLEQVLAWRECAAAGAEEGLLCDAGGRPRSAIAGNLLWLRDGQWHTPRLTDCGVHGVARAALLEAGCVVETEPASDACLEADALALVNSVRGIRPVRWLASREWAIMPALRRLQQRLAELEPAFAHDS